MNTNDLTLLQTLLELRNITQTAELLHIAQPAVTVRLGKLRDQFKDDLLVRKGNSMYLTERAESLLEPLRKINSEINELIFTSKPFDPHEPHLFSILMNEYCSDAIAGELVKKILSFNTNHIISVETISNFYDESKEISVNDIDIVLTDEIFSSNNYYIETLYEDGFSLIYDKYFDSPPSSISMDEYLSLPHLTFSRSDDRNNFSNALGVPDTRNIKARVNSFRTAINLLQDKYVITGIGKLASYYNLNSAPLPFKAGTKKLKLFVPERLKHTPKNRWLRGLCKEVVKEKTLT